MASLEINPACFVAVPILDDIAKMSDRIAALEDTVRKFKEIEERLESLSQVSNRESTQLRATITRLTHEVDPERVFVSNMAYSLDRFTADARTAFARVREGMRFFEGALCNFHPEHEASCAIEPATPNISIRTSAADSIYEADAIRPVKRVRYGNSDHRGILDEEN